jgi:hypothetical protein
MNSLHLTPLGANQTEVRYGDNYVLFSYQTPVAYRNKDGKEFYSATKYSNTTSKHISGWLHDKAAATKVEQSAIDSLVK